MCTPTKLPPPSPHKIKISDPPAKTFLKFLTPSQKKKTGGGGACPERRIKTLKKYYRNGPRYLDEYWQSVTHLTAEFH